MWVVAIVVANAVVASSAVEGANVAALAERSSHDAFLHMRQKKLNFNETRIQTRDKMTESAIQTSLLDNVPPSDLILLFLLLQISSHANGNILCFSACS